MIKAQAIGHLGNDAVVNNVNGKNVINFSVAHSEKYKNEQGVEVNKTTWISCAYWTDKLSVATYLKKGTQVYVEGQPSAKSYKDNSGQIQVQLTIRVNNIQLLGGKKDSNQSQPTSEQPQPGEYTQSSELTEPMDDLPF